MPGNVTAIDEVLRHEEEDEAEDADGQDLLMRKCDSSPKLVHFAMFVSTD